MFTPSGSVAGSVPGVPPVSGVASQAPGGTAGSTAKRTVYGDTLLAPL